MCRNMEVLASIRRSLTFFSPEDITIGYFLRTTNLPEQKYMPACFRGFFLAFYFWGFVVYPFGWGTDTESAHTDADYPLDPVPASIWPLQWICFTAFLYYCFSFYECLLILRGIPVTEDILSPSFRRKLQWICYETFITLWILCIILLLLGLPVSHYKQPEQGIIVGGVFASSITEFLISKTYFKVNHVLLVLTYACLWLLVQMAWLFTGHGPPFTMLDFQDWKSIVLSVLTAIAIIGAFFGLRYLSFVRNRFVENRWGRAANGEDDKDQ